MHGNMCSQRVYIYECRFTEDAAIVSQLPPATAAPRPAKVSPPIKLPVLDERLRISSSKVLPVLSALLDVPLTLLRSSRRARLGVGTTPP